MVAPARALSGFPGHGVLAGGSLGAAHGALVGGWSGASIHGSDLTPPSDFARAGATMPAPAPPVAALRWRGRPPDVVRPLLPPQDPLASLVEGSVPAGRRFCSGCDAALGPERGQCPGCGQTFSFVPTLGRGERVAGRYEVKGTLAFGGLGWIYLALDQVLGRWVVLKGVLNTHDPRLLAVAAQEREHLAALRHPQVVALHDVLTHGREGFLVMEYVNGRSLAALRRQAGGPLPPADALAYLVEALPALEYLGSMGLIHCDIKPDNLMVEEGAGVRLIDLGAVRRVDQEGGDVYGSRGYSAPEADERPSLRSDVYSAGRTLAVLVASFDYQGAHEHSLPPASECEVWRRHPPLLALLERATAARPDDRFAS
ncbi:MAG: serine/threonine protein kinase, partial [Myxococcales bacterium]